MTAEHWWILVGSLVAGAAIGVLGTVAWVGRKVSEAIGRGLNW
jgi:hypothetical protein